MNEKEEQCYIDGRNSALRRLWTAIERELNANGVETDQADMAEELALCRRHVKAIFEEFEIPDYDENLYLPDLIEKTLFRWIQAREGE